MGKMNVMSVNELVDQIKISIAMKFLADKVTESIKVKCPEFDAMSRGEFVPYALLIASAAGREIDGLSSVARDTKKDELDDPENKFALATNAAVDRLSNLAVEMYRAAHGQPLH